MIVKLLVALLLLPLTTVATSVELKVGVMPFPPYYHIDKYGGASGIYVDIIENVLTRAKLDHSFRGYPNARFYKYLQNGEFHLFFGSTKGNKEIEKHLLYSKKPLKDAIELRIYTRRGDETPPISKLADLYGKKLILIHGFRYSGMLKKLESIENRSNIYVAKGHLAGLQILMTGRADYLLDYRNSTETLVKELGEEKFAHEVALSIPAYIMLHKSFPNAQETMNKIEKSYWEIIAE